MHDAADPNGARIIDERSELRPELRDQLASFYGDMRVLARKLMSGNALASSLQPTELANEVAIRLIRSRMQSVSGEAHFLALAARTMRQILIDEARKISSAKRQAPLFLTIWPGGGHEELVDIAQLDEALKALAALSAERAQIVELRFMLGMTVEETAAAAGMSPRTVKRHWQAARAWLMDFLKSGGDVRLS